MYTPSGVQILLSFLVTQKLVKAKCLSRAGGSEQHSFWQFSTGAVRKKLDITSSRHKGSAQWHRSFPTHSAPKRSSLIWKGREGDTMFAAAVKHAKSTPSLGRDRIAGKPIFPKLGRRREIQNSLHLLRSSVPSRRF